MSLRWDGVSSQARRTCDICGALSERLDVWPTTQSVGTAMGWEQKTMRGRGVPLQDICPKCAEKQI